MCISRVIGCQTLLLSLFQQNILITPMINSHWYSHSSSLHFHAGAPLDHGTQESRIKSCLLVKPNCLTLEMSFCGGTCRALKTCLWQKPHPISIIISHNSFIHFILRQLGEKICPHVKPLYPNLTLHQVTISSGPRFYWETES